MTHVELVDAIRAAYPHLLRRWIADCESYQDVGALVFFPDSYNAARFFDQVPHEFWPLPKIRVYLEKGGQSDQALVRLLGDLNLKEEFLVMIIEHGRYEHRQFAHIYRIRKSDRLSDRDLP